MTRDLDTSFVDKMAEDVSYPFFTVSLAFDGGNEINLWTGENDLSVGGVTYTGAGSLLNISDVEETTEMAVRGATLTLSGIDASIISLALSEPYQGRPCELGFGLFNAFTPEEEPIVGDNLQNYTLSGAGGTIIEGSLFHTSIFAGYMDTMDVAEGAGSSIIKLSVVNKLVDLERSRRVNYNSAAQKIKYPEDKGLDYVESITNQELFWGVSNPR